MRTIVICDDISDVRAVDVAGSAARGWMKYARDRKVSTSVESIPLADGGPGFINSLRASLHGDILIRPVTGPLGETTPASIMIRSEKQGKTAYIESAEACGIHLMPAEATETRSVYTATSQGVGELLNTAVDLGATRIIVGIGGTGTNDGGAGLLAGVGAGKAAKLGQGPRGIEALNISDIDLTQVRRRLAHVDLIAACATSAPLLGFHGASGGYAENKGASRADAQELERYLSRFGNLTLQALQRSRQSESRGRLEIANYEGANAPGSELKALPGAGSGGGIGYALALLGARLLPGARVSAGEIGLAEKVKKSDLIVALADHLDATTLSEGQVPIAAEIAGQYALPAIVVARRVDAGARELAASGITSAYPLVDLVSTSTSPQHVVNQIEERLYRIARSWAR